MPSIGDLVQLENRQTQPTESFFTANVLWLSRFVPSVSIPTLRSGAFGLLAQSEAPELNVWSFVRMFAVAYYGLLLVRACFMVVTRNVADRNRNPSAADAAAIIIFERSTVVTTAVSIPVIILYSVFGFAAWLFGSFFPLFTYLESGTYEMLYAAYLFDRFCQKAFCCITRKRRLGDPSGRSQRTVLMNFARFLRNTADPSAIKVVLKMARTRLNQIVPQLPGQHDNQDYVDLSHGASDINEPRPSSSAAFNDAQNAFRYLLQQNGLRVINRLMGRPNNQQQYELREPEEDRSPLSVASLLSSLTGSVFRRNRNPALEHAAAEELPESEPLEHLNEPEQPAAARDLASHWERELNQSSMT